MTGILILSFVCLAVILYFILTRKPEPEYTEEEKEILREIIRTNEDTQ